jgi:hypothetical protein
VGCGVKVNKKTDELVMQTSVLVRDIKKNKQEVVYAWHGGLTAVFVP